VLFRSGEEEILEGARAAATNLLTRAAEARTEE
jgi:hypothetical protein